MATATPTREERPPANLITAALLAPAVFIDRFCWLRPAAGGAPQRFRLWAEQVEALDYIEEHDRVIFLKARQLGLSWIAAAYALWLCSANSGQTALIISQGLREAVVQLDRVKFMHDRLPAELRQGTGNDRVDQIEFPGRDSRIISLPASKHAGSGYTATLVVMDEWAKIERAEQLYTAIMPTLSAGGKFVGISTAQGRSNLFADIWRDASPKLSDHWEPSEHDSEWWPFFLPSSAHPARDGAWHERERRRLLTDRRFWQEYPEQPSDAFQRPGTTVFGDDFDRGRHTTTADRAPEGQWPVWRGVDFGYHHSPVHWIEVQANRVAFVFAELDAEHLTTDELGREIVAYDQKLNVKTGEAKAGVDPAGTGTNVQTSDSDIAVLQRHGIPVAEVSRRGSGSALRRVPPKDRVDLIKSLLRDGRLVINHHRCPRLVEALEEAQWDRVGGEGALRETYQKDGTFDHYLDSLGYALINVFPSQAKPAGASQRPAVAAGSTYSPSEFG